MGLARTIDPASLLTLAQAKLHLRVDADTIDDDTLIALYADAAVDLIEGYLERAVLEQTWAYTLDAFPMYPPFGSPALAPGRAAWPSWIVAGVPVVPSLDLRIRLPRPSLRAVVSVKYLDQTGAQVTLDPAAYVVDTSGLPGSVAPAYGTSWPATLPVPNAVTVTFTTGFSDDPAKIPAAIVAAALLTLGDLYMNRDSSSSGGELGGAACNLLAKYVYREAV